MSRSGAFDHSSIWACERAHVSWARGAPHCSTKPAWNEYTPARDQCTLTQISFKRWPGALCAPSGAPRSAGAVLVPHLTASPIRGGRSRQPSGPFAQPAPGSPTQTSRGLPRTWCLCRAAELVLRVSMLQTAGQRSARAPPNQTENFSPRRLGMLRGKVPQTRTPRPTQAKIIVPRFVAPFTV